MRYPRKYQTIPQLVAYKTKSLGYIVSVLAATQCVQITLQD